MKNPFEKFTGNIEKYKRLQGGDINEVYDIHCSRGRFVLKSNSQAFDQMFAKEAKALRLLKEKGLPVPHVVDVCDNALLLEYCAPGEVQPDLAGSALASLHSNSVAEFGLEYDNYIGSLVQINKSKADWSDFFWQNRIQAQLQLLGRDLPRSQSEVWHNLEKKIPSLIDHQPKPSLLHGDLWSGNLIWSAKGPMFIDPAIYYGDPLIELAFTKLFGSFGARFYDAYKTVLEISPKFNDLLKLYHIYPLLVHANLFGGNYYQSALNNAKYYV